MPIFLMHILAGSGVRIGLRKFLGVESALVHVIAGTVAGVILPWLAYRADALRRRLAVCLPMRGDRMQQRMAAERRGGRSFFAALPAYTTVPNRPAPMKARATTPMPIDR
ncbi:MAG: hypothetical protein GAK35_02886 [Herbaspirillum frisingense]|uniref:Uncharacterized protein n=1 Tax=Herbaspirillum frisingense TaxID=92645 RepID=A0A7V8FVA3_9BURK|nr:MAG: hypothetical protein GAK35_02886 [Herbaspirillum frisingense]